MCIVIIVIFGHYILMLFVWNDIVRSLTVSSAPQVCISLLSADVSYFIYVCLKCGDIFLFFSRKRAIYPIFSACLVKGDMFVLTCVFGFSSCLSQSCLGPL
jgi:hypothetical protein